MSCIFASRESKSLELLIIHESASFSFHVGNLGCWLFFWNTNSECQCETIKVFWFITLFGRERTVILPNWSWILSSLRLFFITFHFRGLYKHQLTLEIHYEGSREDFQGCGCSLFEVMSRHSHEGMQKFTVMQLVIRPRFKACLFHIHLYTALIHDLFFVV
jgi:hypothetical protein